jgi:hypothetical protein
MSTVNSTIERVAERHWPSPPARLADPCDDVHLFRADLDDPRRNVDLYRLMLTDPELRRVDDVRHGHTRRRLAIACGLAHITRAAHLVERDREPLVVVRANLGALGVLAAARAPRIGLALVPSARGARGVELATLEAIGNAGGRTTGRETVDASRVGPALATGCSLDFVVTSHHGAWHVQVLGLAPAVCLVVALEERRRVLRCWELGA